MKDFIQKYSVTLFYFFVSTLIVLMVTMALLYYRHNAVQSRNRSLILQNDSILSVNIELKHMLERVGLPEKKALVTHQ